MKSEPTGFDFWSVLPGQGEYFNPEFIEMGQKITKTGYVTDIITEEALRMPLIIKGIGQKSEVGIKR